MADEYGAWKSVESGNAPGTVKGEITEEGGAAFRYRKFFDAFYSFASIDTTLGGGGEIVEATWKIQILAGENGMVIFEQEVTLKFLLIVQVVLGSVGFFFWSPANDGEKVVTTIVDGRVIDPSEAWKYTDDSTPSIYSEQGDVRIGDPDDPTDDMNATSDFTEEGGHVAGAWISAPYRMEIPAGAVLKVVTQKWKGAGVGNVNRDATFQFSLKGTFFASLVDAVNALRLGISRGGALVSDFAYAGNSDRRERALLHQASQPSEWKDDTNRMWRACYFGATGANGRAYALFWSEDDARSWHRLTTKNAEGNEMPIEIWPDGYSSPHTIGLKNGGGASVATKGGRIYVKATSDLKFWPGATEVRLPGGSVVQAEGAYRISEEVGTMRLVLTNGKKHIFVSDTSARTWQEL